jgi:hypothetical protein
VFNRILHQFVILLAFRAIAFWCIRGQGVRKISGGNDSDTARRGNEYFLHGSAKGYVVFPGDWFCVGNRHDADVWEFFTQADERDGAAMV